MARSCDLSNIGCQERHAKTAETASGGIILAVCYELAQACTAPPTPLVTAPHHDALIAHAQQEDPSRSVTKSCTLTTRTVSPSTVVLADADDDAV